MESPRRVVLDIDSTEIPVYGQQEQGAYNGHFESTGYHPPLLFNRKGDCLAVKLRPGNGHSADDRDRVLLPEVERQQGQGKDVVLRADAAFAKPELYEALEARGVKYAIRIPSNDTLSRLSRNCFGGPSDDRARGRWFGTRASAIKQSVGRSHGGSGRRSNFPARSCSPGWASS